MATDRLSAEIARLGFNPDYPEETIRGVPLSDKQYDDHVRVSGRLSRNRLEELVGMPGWDQLSDSTKLALMDRTVKSARRLSETAVMMGSQGTENDIVARATAAKKAMASA